MYSVGHLHVKAHGNGSLKESQGPIDVCVMCMQYVKFIMQSLTLRESVYDSLFMIVYYVECLQVFNTVD